MAFQSAKMSITLFPGWFHVLKGLAAAEGCPGNCNAIGQMPGSSRVIIRRKAAVRCWLGATMDRYHSQCKAVPNQGQS